MAHKESAHGRAAVAEQEVRSLVKFFSTLTFGPNFYRTNGLRQAVETRSNGGRRPRRHSSVGARSITVVQRPAGRGRGPCLARCRVPAHPSGMDPCWRSAYRRPADPDRGHSRLSCRMPSTISFLWLQTACRLTIDLASTEQTAYVRPSKYIRKRPPICLLRT